MRNVFVLALTVLFLFSFATYGQTLTTGQISGVITDASGAAVPNATVTVVNRDTGARRVTASNNLGYYSATLLDPGRYRVTAEAQGFQTVTVEDIAVEVSQSQRADFKMQVGKVEQRVLVTSEPQLIQTSNPNTTTTLNAVDIDAMPNPGMDLTYLATVAPGAVMNTVNPGGYNGGNVEFNGLPTVANDFTIDGLSANESWENLNMTGATGLMLGANAVQEVSINTQSYAVEQGRLGAAQMNYVTKSGTNQFHGNAYEIWNGSDMNTTNYFIKANPTPSKKPFSNVNEFGGSVGGPVLKNKLFFFTDIEGIRIELPSVQTATIPSAPYQAYVLQQLPLGGTDTIQPAPLPPEPAEVPLYQKMFGLISNSTAGTPIPVQGCPFDVGGGSPANPNDGTGCALQQLRSFSNPVGETLYTFKVDYNIDKADTVWFRFQLDNGNSVTPNLVNSIFNVYDNQPTRSASAGWTHTFGPNLVNQFNPGLYYENRVHNFKDYAAAVAAMPIAYDAVPFSSFGTSNTPYGDRSFEYQFTDNVLWTHGRHEMKFGVNFLRNLYSSEESAGFLIPFAEALSLPEFTYGASAVTQAYYPTYIVDHLGSVNMDLYAADTFKLRPNLTLTFGLRAAWNSNPVSYDNVLSRLAAPFESLDHDVNQPLNSVIASNQHHNFNATPLIIWQPRAAVAYEVRRGTVLRLGGGIFTAPPQGFVPTYADENAPSNASFSTGLLYGQGVAVFPGVPGSAIDAAAADNAAFQSGFKNGALSCASPSAGPNCIAPITYYNFETGKEFKYPIYFQWSGGIEHQIGNTNLVSVKYVGTRSTHNFYISAPNGYQTACDGCWAPYQYNTAPDQRFGNVFTFDTGANSNYNALQASYEKKMGHGLSLRANYTYSHCLDNGSNGGDIIFQDNTDFYAFDGQLKRYWGNCDYDVTHSFNASYYYQLPFHSSSRLVDAAIAGWQVSGTVYLRGGFPVSVYSNYPSTILNSTAAYVVFANRVPGVSEYAKSPIPGITTPGTVQWLNPQAFQSVVNPADGSCYPANAPQYCQNGDLGRNTVRLPGFKWTDLDIGKKFKITERVSFKVEGEFYNLFNHPNFGLPTSATGYQGTPQAGIPAIPSTLIGFGVINTTVSPSTGLLGTPSLGGDSSVRMIAFRGSISF